MKFRICSTLNKSHKDILCNIVKGEFLKRNMGGKWKISHKTKNKKDRLKASKEGNF